jgi:hypothetical protein
MLVLAKVESAYSLSLAEVVFVVSIVVLTLGSFGRVEILLSDGPRGEPPIGARGPPRWPSASVGDGNTLLAKKVSCPVLNVCSLITTWNT